MKKWICFFLIFCAISACQNNPAQTATPVPSLTSKSQATQAEATLPPTASAIPPTITPVPPSITSALRTSGPYLLYFKQVGEKWSLIELDADGVGRKEIPLPAEADASRAQLSADGKYLLFFASVPSDDSAHQAYGWYLLTLSTAEISFLNDVGEYVNDFRPSFSPDGKWVVFYTPVLPPPNVADSSCPCSLTLNLKQMSDGKIVKQLNLLPPDYPQNFDKLQKFLASGVLGDGISITTLQNSFLQGIDSVSWSPDGRSMAFSGGMDGPSSDLYVYDLQTQAITRLSDGWENIQSIDWSSDGKSIFQASSYYDACEGDCNSYYVATLDGKPPVKVMSDQTDHRILSDWLTPSRELLYTNDNGVGQAYLRYFDHDTKQTVDIYPYSFNSFALDPVSKMLIVVSLDKNVEGTPLGIHLVNPSDASRQTLDAGVCNHPGSPVYGVASALSIDQYRFVVKCPDGTVLVALDGSVRTISDHALDVTSIPERGGLLGFDREGQEAILFSANLDLVYRIKIHSPQLGGWNSDAAIWWRADGDGVFYLSKQQLYYLDLASGSEKFIDDGIVEVKQWIKN